MDDLWALHMLGAHWSLVFCYGAVIYYNLLPPMAWTGRGESMVLHHMLHDEIIWVPHTGWDRIMYGRVVNRKDHLNKLFM